MNVAFWAHCSIIAFVSRVYLADGSRALYTALVYGFYQ